MFTIKHISTFGMQKYNFHVTDLMADMSYVQRSYFFRDITQFHLCMSLFEQVRVTDLMGGSLGKLTVTADSAKNQGDESVVLSKKPFTGGKEYVA